MRALATNRFGGNDVLELTEVPDPIVGPDTVLVRTRAVGLNPVDWKSVRGGLEERFPNHFPLVPGWDVAGVVERVGPSVTEFAVGDDVMAYDREDHVQWGTLAELVGVPIRCVAPKPAGLGWVEAGALPLAGLTAYQCVIAVGVGPGDTVLVHAASGGVGSFAVQFSSWAGARVIGTASPANHDYLRNLGAEPVAYGGDLVARVRDLAPEGASVIIDLVGGDALEASLDLGNAELRLVGVTNPDRVKALGGRYVFVRPSSEQLAELGRFAADGSLKVHVRETFPFEQAVDALARVEEGHGQARSSSCSTSDPYISMGAFDLVAPFHPRAVVVGRGRVRAGSRARTRCVNRQSAIPRQPSTTARFAPCLALGHGAPRLSDPTTGRDRSLVGYRPAPGARHPRRSALPARVVAGSTRKRSAADGRETLDAHRCKRRCSTCTTPLVRPATRAVRPAPSIPVGRRFS